MTRQSIDSETTTPQKRRRLSSPRLPSDVSISTPSGVTTRSPSAKPAPHPLVVCLQPIRSLLHPFLTDDDAARLLRVSRTTAFALLPGFVFFQHVFEGESQAQMLRMKALYEAYDVWPTLMCLSRSLTEVSLEEGSGRSPFPSTLTSLLLGPRGDVLEEESGELDVVHLYAAAHEEIHCYWTGPESEDVGGIMMDESEPVRRFVSLEGQFSCPFPPGLLPHGLRRLHFARGFYSPLLPGSIPSTVETLQVQCWDYPLLKKGETLLPSSLVHLAIIDLADQPLLPGVFPSSLQRLRIDQWNAPLHVNVLPASLRALHLGRFDHPLLPGALPVGLTHLVLKSFSYPLTEGSLPSTLISIDLGWEFHQPLPPSQPHRRLHPLPFIRRHPSDSLTNHLSPLSAAPGILPSSLRVLWYRAGSRHPLVKGALPEGLEVLHWDATAADVDLEVGVLPSSLRVLQLKLALGRGIQPGALPDELECLGLPDVFKGLEEVGKLPVDCRVWWLEHEQWTREDDDAHDDESEDDEMDEEERYFNGVWGEEEEEEDEDEDEGERESE
jgi:hypothetical protein